MLRKGRGESQSQVHEDSKEKLFLLVINTQHRAGTQDTALGAKPCGAPPAACVPACARLGLCSARSSGLPETPQDLTWPSLTVTLQACDSGPG